MGILKRSNLMAAPVHFDVRGKTSQRNDYTKDATTSLPQLKSRMAKQVVQFDALPSPRTRGCSALPEPRTKHKRVRVYAGEPLEKQTGDTIVIQRR